ALRRRLFLALSLQPPAHRRLSESQPLSRRALPRAGRRGDGQAALLRDRLLVGEEGEPERHHSQGHAGALCRPNAGNEEETRLKTKLLGAIAALCVSVVAWAQAQNYPNRPVRVVVAAATGGPDIVARVVAAKLQEQMGQAFVVENQPGANGIVGATTVAKAPPDGYTLLVYSSGFVINPYVHKSLPYDTEKDFVPVTNLVTNGGLFFAVANSVPVKSMQEFIEYAKKPGVHLAYSTPGIGNTWHLAMEVLDVKTGIKMTHI